MPLLAAGKPLQIPTWRNSEPDLPQQRLSSMPAPALGFCTSAEAGKGTASIFYRCSRGAFVTCSAAVGHETKNLKRLAWQRVTPSVCFTARCIWVCGVCSTRRLQDQHLHEMGASDTTPCSPKPPSSLTRGGHKALKDPALSTTRGNEINPQTLNFCLFHLFLN